MVANLPSTNGKNDAWFQNMRNSKAFYNDRRHILVGWVQVVWIMLWAVNALYHLSYQVCPFEVAVECELGKLFMTLLKSNKDEYEVERLDPAWLHAKLGNLIQRRRNFTRRYGSRAQIRVSASKGIL